MKTVFTYDQIKDRVRVLGESISGDYAGRDLVIIGVLKGAFIFTADLLRSLTVPAQVDFVRLASYGSRMTTAGEISFTKDIEIPVKGRDVLIVEDIVDTGGTLRFLMEIMACRGPGSLKACALLSKSERRNAEVVLDYVGFEVSRGFLVGYGLDYRENYRYLKDICLLEAGGASQICASTP